MSSSVPSMMTQRFASRRVVLLISRAALLACLVAANPTPVAACIDEAATGECWDCYGISRIHWELLLPALLLVLMAGIALTLILERLLWFAIARRQSRQFLSKIFSALYHNRLCEAAALPALYPKSPLAGVVHASINSCSPTNSDGHLRVQPSIDDWNRAIAIKTKEVKRRLWTFAAIGRVVPLVAAFFACAQFGNVALIWRATEGQCVYAYASDLASAAYVMMFGLLVAAPSIWMQKYFSWRSESMVVEMERLSLVILSRFAANSPAREANGLRSSYVTAELPSLATHCLRD